MSRGVRYVQSENLDYGVRRTQAAVDDEVQVFALGTRGIRRGRGLIRDVRQRVRVTFSIGFGVMNDVETCIQMKEKSSL